MSDVFISYSSKDKEVADALCAQIEQQGYSCWIAPRDILPGEDWARSINTAITAAKVFIVIYSRNSCESSQVPKEIGIAGARDLSIIPYKIDDTPLSGDFEYYLLGCHWVAAEPSKGDYKIAELSAAIERVVARREGREPAAVTITNNYAGDNNSVINVQQKPSSGTALKIAVVAAVSLLAVAIVIIILLLTGREKEDNSSQPYLSQPVVTAEASVVPETEEPAVPETEEPAIPETEDAPAAETQESEPQPLSYYEAEAIYTEMVHKLMQTASTNTYSAFKKYFDDTYTTAEVAEIYDIIGFCVDYPQMHISVYEYTSDAIFGMYTFYENAYDGAPIHYHCDFVDDVNVIVRDGDEWRFSRLPEEHPLNTTIEQILYPYGPDSTTCHTVQTYQTATGTVLCDHCMAEVVNVIINEDGTVTVHIELINGDYSFPTELYLYMSVYDYMGNVLYEADGLALETSIASNEIQFYEMNLGPLDYIDEVDLTFFYYDSYVEAIYG